MTAMPSDAPTAPSHNAANVISIFSDNYTDISLNNLLADWDQSAGRSTKTIAANTLIELTQFDYQGIEFQANKQTLYSSASLHFDYWTSNVSSFRFFLIADNGSVSEFLTRSTQPYKIVGRALMLPCLTSLMRE